MRTTNHQPLSVIYKLLIPLCMLLAIQACNPAPDPSPGPTPTDAPPSPEGGSTSNLFGTYLDTLMLNEADYNVLRNTFPSAGAQRSKIVFQFHFDNTAASKPSLIGYASLPGNRFTQGAITTPVSRVLQKGGGHALQLPNLFVLGDQQIRFDDIDAILTAAPDDVILFVPKIQPGEINVRYKVCLRGAACPDPAPTTQPSPPANAN